MVSRGASPLEPEEGAPGARYAHASSLRELLEILVQELRSRSPFERFAIFAGFESHLVSSSSGIAAASVQAYQKELERRARAQDGPDSVQDTGGVASLPGLEPQVVLRAPGPTKDFTLLIVLESDSRHPELLRVRELLRRTAPFVFRAAELHALRLRVATMTSAQLRSRRALDVLPDPVMVMDGESRIQLANQRAEALLVLGPDDSAGRRHAVETNNLFFSAFRARAILDREGEASTRELLLVDPNDGSDLLFEVFLLPFHEPDGTPESTIFVLRDITDLRSAAHELEVQFSRSVAAEHQARRESERLNVIIENAGVPIFVTDRQNSVVLMNREAERLLEMSEGSRASPRLQDIQANDAKLAGFLNDFLLQSRLRHEGRLTLVDPDEAREFPALALSTKILDEHFEPTAVVTVLHDLTQEVENQRLAHELRQLNAELEQRVVDATRELAERNRQLEEQRAALERASRMKSEFLATMSHELRTPINAVLGYNSLLHEGLFGELTEKQGDALTRMRNAAEHLLSVINDILDLSRVEAGKIQVSVSEIDLVAFLDKLSEAVRPMAVEKSLEFTLDVHGDTPAVRTDGTRLRQVLLNLLSNAVKFTEDGSVTLRAQPHENDPAVVMEVIDTGVGIEAEHLETIFDEFTQVDQSVTREHGGTGLGLAIAQRLIRIMGGTLTVESEPGVGTTFRVELPVTPPVTWGDTGGGSDASGVSAAV